jgi:hypothetical protein
MQQMRSGKSRFWMMWTAAMLAVLSIVASPAIAISCCCDSIASGHSHSSTPSDSHHHDTDDHGANHHQEQVQTSDSTSLSRASIGEACDHTRCEVAPLVISHDRNQATFFAPILALSAQLFTFQTAQVSSVSIFANCAARPRAPDRYSCSGLSPPAPSRS